MMWRSTLKAKAREWVTWHYPLGGNRSAKENLSHMQELVRGAMFVRDGTEEDVRSPHSVPFSPNIYLQGMTRNMASPALAGLVTEFFYTGPSALVTLFPEVFAREVPKSVVCLVATAVSDHFLSTKCSLDITGGIPQFLF